MEIIFLAILRCLGIDLLNKLKIILNVICKKCVMQNTNINCLASFAAARCLNQRTAWSAIGRSFFLALWKHINSTGFIVTFTSFVYNSVIMCHIFAGLAPAYSRYMLCRRYYHAFVSNLVNKTNFTISTFKAHDTSAVSNGDPEPHAIPTQCISTAVIRSDRITDSGSANPTTPSLYHHSWLRWE